MKAVDDVPVSITDDLGDADKGQQTGHVVTFGDFRPTNVPLSAFEVEERRKLMDAQHKTADWPARTVDNTGDTAPIEEHGPPASEAGNRD
ncbi:MAG TPA: hypothetical protein VKU01_21965 [Bryobacteraceae bacterium]|nr:hypothetical protein [Bryobacteraceae bacterium]